MSPESIFSDMTPVPTEPCGSEPARDSDTPVNISATDSPSREQITAIRSLHALPSHCAVTRAFHPSAIQSTERAGNVADLPWN